MEAGNSLPPDPPRTADQLGSAETYQEREGSSNYIIRKVVISLLACILEMLGGNSMVEGI